jgi:hypothetical protein
MLTETSLALTSEPTLELEAMLDLAYEQTLKIVQADVFYVAFFDARTETISFPLAVESGGRWSYGVGQGNDHGSQASKEDYRSRKAADGMTEYVIRSGRSLLLARNVDEWTAKEGIQLIGEPAHCWLGAPMKARGRVIGVLAVQDFAEEDRFDAVHEMALTILANQVATAIENVRLFKARERTMGVVTKIVDSVPQLIAAAGGQQVAEEAVRFVCSAWHCSCGYYAHPQEGVYSLVHSSPTSGPGSPFPVSVCASDSQSQQQRQESTASAMLVDCVSDDLSIEAVLWVKRGEAPADSPEPFSGDDRRTLGLFARVLSHLARERRIRADFSAARSSRAEETDAG